ncbi:MAG TPA: hypothetical protein VE968_09115 [Sphingomicrobium sp.]|nr:hypothetical protein [Sphingomicrobium sp.]
MSRLAAEPTAATLKVQPAAVELLERDWVLMNWALKHFDRNGDLLLEPDELRVAAEAFRTLADANHDGRVTPQEYAAAREEILKHD